MSYQLKEPPNLNSISIYMAANELGGTLNHIIVHVQSSQRCHRTSNKI